jgi:predicted RNase H-like HicB family nuclease
VYIQITDCCQWLSQDGLEFTSEIWRKRLKFLITIFQDEDGMFIAECPAIPGCVSQGKTEVEAERNINEAIKECLAVRAEKGLPLTVSYKLQ